MGRERDTLAAQQATHRQAEDCLQREIARLNHELEEARRQEEESKACQKELTDQLGFLQAELRRNLAGLRQQLETIQKSGSCATKALDSKRK
jgi:hypothetical protein